MAGNFSKNKWSNPSSKATFQELPPTRAPRVTALSNGILKPIINMVLYYCFGGDNDALDKMYTVLVKVYKVEDGKQVLDLANSILIDI